jgi:alpha-tubulin suppressor-like RCC1 family protein
LSLSKELSSVLVLGAQNSPPYFAIPKPRWATASQVAMLLLIAGCGGGDSGAAATPPVPKKGAQAAVLTPVTGKTPWNVSTPTQFFLKDESGSAISAVLTCSSPVPESLEVAADCASVKGLRLGPQTVTVSGGGVSAQASIKVIAQPQPLGSRANSGNYNAVVTPDGRVLTWGDSRLGQNASGAAASVSLPTAVKDTAGSGLLTGIVAASAGKSAALALTEDGEVYSWGSGYLGRTANNGDPLPGKVLDATGNAALQRIVSIAANDNGGTALADDGVVYSWGNFSGQPGASTARVPGVVPLAAKAVAVSAGSAWNAALLADGRVMTWGYSSSYNNLGRPGVTSSDAPPGFVLDAVTSQPLTNVVSVSAGWLHGLALNAAGQIQAWGHNSYGELGQNLFSNSSASAVLVKTPSGASAWSGITMVAAGGNHSLAMDAAGKVYSWGYSQNGELGDGANHPRVNSSALPAAVVTAAGLGQLSDIRAIATGFRHSVALSSDGSVLIWGIGLRGNLGQGGTNETLSYLPLVVKNETGTAPLMLSPLSYWPNLLQR